jgi:hypothetical protein
MLGFEADTCRSGYGPVVASCEHSNAPLGFTEGKSLLE